MEIHELIEKITSERNCGITHLIVQDRQAFVEVKESIFEIVNACFGADMAGSTDFNNMLIEIKNKELASSILTNLLSRDMAHNYPIMSFETAKKMAEDFLNLFDISPSVLRTLLGILMSFLQLARRSN